ncbi:MAG: hypothetical protein QOE70_443 [Chthoniobacter sp.]|jgi:hypothetical protein|nr:hypothetical protein [Chthoniobacter sp.]
MKRIVSAGLGILAASSLLGAQYSVLATIPLAGSMRLSETSWGGGGRLWLAALLIAVAVVLQVCEHRGSATLVTGLCLGLLVDMGISGWYWRAEKMAMLNEFGAGGLEKSIRWRVGLWWLGAAYVFVLAFSLATFYPRSPTNQGRFPN